MKIDAGASYLFATQRNQAPARTNTHDFAEMLSSRLAERHDAGTSAANSSGPDFTSMTRQELRDWVNGQIRNGAMSLDESGVFLGLGGMVAAGGGSIDQRLQSERVNFYDMARSGIDFYTQRGDTAAAERLLTALDIMGQAQGNKAGA